MNRRTSPRSTRGRGVAASLAALIGILVLAVFPTDAPRRARAADYSPLAQITSEKVEQLRLAWSFSTGFNYPNVLYARAARRGALRWKYDPKPSRAAQGEACCDHVPVYTRVYLAPRWL